MATMLDLQREILEELKDYSPKIIQGAEIVIEELRDGKMEDSDEIFNQLIQGINWVIEVFNNCENLINKEKTYVDKTKMAQAVGRLGAVLKERDDIKIAACLEVDFLPFLRSMEEVSNNIQEICKQNEE